MAAISLVHLMGTLTPNLTVLPESQRLIWPQLESTPRHFVLYGGTALALRLGHRESVDFDFFSNLAFQPFALAQSIAYLRDQPVTQRGESKDYLDIHALIVRGKMSLTEGLAAAGAIFGRQYNPVLTLQALSYFEDLPEPLAGSVKADLSAAVRSVSLQHLPQMVATYAIDTYAIGEGA